MSRHSGKKITFLENGSANSAAFTWDGGKGLFMAEATFGGGSVGLEIQTPNGTWVALITALTADGVSTFSAPRGKLRASVATATAAYAYAVSIVE